MICSIIICIFTALLVLSFDLVYQSFFHLIFLYHFIFQRTVTVWFKFLNVFALPINLHTEAIIVQYFFCLFPKLFGFTCCLIMSKFTLVFYHRVRELDFILAVLLHAFLTRFIALLIMNILKHSAIVFYFLQNLRTDYLLFGFLFDIFSHQHFQVLFHE